MKKRAKPKSSPRSYALWLLGRQAYSAARLRERMIRRGFEEAEAEDAVAYLIEIGYLDDASFAKNFVEARARSGHGPRKLRWELHNRGVDTAHVAEALDGLSEKLLLEQAESLALRRLRSKDPRDPKVISATYRHLLQRGYDNSLVQAVLEKVRSNLDRQEQNS